MSTINERIRIFRIHKGLNQKDFSEKIKTPRSTLSEVESGKRCPSVELVIGISNAFEDVSDKWILTGEGEMLKSQTVNSGFNSERLALAIETVEEGLQETRRSMQPNKKAELVLAVYELFGEQTPSIKQNVLRLVKSAA